jgi:multisubunit Na+/H+ antiporter MnhE subunit
MLKIKQWMNRHKFLTGVIIAFVILFCLAMIFPNSATGLGEVCGLILFIYLVVTLIAWTNRKLKNK